MSSLKRPKYVNKPFSRLPLKQRAVFVLFLAGFTYKELQKLGVAAPECISDSIKRGYGEYTR